jgi:hypothetical protein
MGAGPNRGSYPSSKTERWPEPEPLMGHFKMEFPWGMTPDGTGAKLGGREPEK